MTKMCSVEGCLSEVLARGWCSKHWQRWSRHGDPLKALRVRATGTLTERFLARFVQGPPEECWLWEGTTDKHGYGVIRGEGKLWKAHRFSYRHFTGTPPRGILDHECRVKRCVNPNPGHLRPATSKENAENSTHTTARSGVRGVAWDGASGKWRGQVSHHGKTHHTRRFGTVEEAAEAVEALRRSLHTHAP